MGPEFPVGYHRLHDDVGLNFQLNRFLPGGRIEDFRRAAARIHDLHDWKREFLALAEEAEKDERRLHAATCFRAAEFFMVPDDPDKQRAYQRFVDLFEELRAGEAWERREVPYADGALPVLHLPAPEPAGPKDVVLVHGGFDSFMEELYGHADFLRQAGYEVILFEGPGQGAALKHHGLPMTPEWEHPVAAVIDHFGLEQCSLLGLSLGGCLAPRAAAFEPRIRRVIAWDVLDDFLDCFAHARGRALGSVLRAGVALGARRLLDGLAARRMERDTMIAWAIPHGMHVMGVDSPYEFFCKVRRFDTAPYSSRIRQDFLLLAGARDHYVPLRQFHRQARRLVNVRSFTGRIFTEAEQAQNHCQVGNVGLALRTIVGWLDERVAEGA